MLFKRKSSGPKPKAVYTYPQTEDFRGFKRIKLSSYGYKPAQDGIRALTGKDLSGSKIKISIFADDNTRAVVSVDDHILGSIWERFDNFDLLRRGKIAAVHLVVEDGDAVLFYKA